MALAPVSSKGLMPNSYKFGVPAQIRHTQLQIKFRSRAHLCKLGNSPVSMKYHFPSTHTFTLDRKCNVCKCLDHPSPGLTSNTTVMEIIFKFVRKLLSTNFLRSSNRRIVAMVIACIVLAIKHLPALLLTHVFNLTHATASELVIVAVWILLLWALSLLRVFASKDIYVAGGVAGVVLTFLMQKVFSNAISGTVLQGVKGVKVGDFVQVRIKDRDLTGRIESMGLFSPLVLRGVSGETIHISNDKFVDSFYTSITRDSQHCISLRFTIGSTEAELVDDILEEVNKILGKFSTNDDDEVDDKKNQNMTCVEGMDSKGETITILAYCYVKATDVEDYLQIKGTIELEVFKLLSRLRRKNLIVLPSIET